MFLVRSSTAGGRRQSPPAVPIFHHHHRRRVVIVVLRTAAAKRCCGRRSATDEQLVLQDLRLGYCNDHRHGVVLVVIVLDDGCGRRSIAGWHEGWGGGGCTGGDHRGGSRLLRLDGNVHGVVLFVGVGRVGVIAVGTVLTDDDHIVRQMATLVVVMVVVQMKQRLLMVLLLLMLLLLLLLMVMVLVVVLLMERMMVNVMRMVQVMIG